MLGFIAIAYRDWTRQQLHRLAGAILIISTGVGAYATLRWLTGPTGAENKLLQNAGDYANTINATGGNRVIGSFPNGPALGFWAATALPFCLALVLFGSRRMRWAALGLPLLVVGVLGSGSRASLVSAGVGTLLVLALALFARAEPRQQVTVVGGAMLVMAVFGGFLFSRVVADNPAKVARYANILTPGNDASFAGRIDKWTAVVTAVDTHPIGFGIGTASPGGPRIRFPSKAADNVDSAYMQVAYEQGIPVMVLYIVALLVLLVGLARRGRVARDRFHAGLQIGAAGAFVAFIIVCVAGQFQFDLIATGVWIMAALGVAVGLRSPSAIPDSLPAAERTRVPEPVA
jgi:O-antigen ligase